MTALARFVARHRWWTVIAWIVLALAGAFAAPRATDALSDDFGLPGRPGYEANQEIARRFESGGENAPVLLAVTTERGTLGAVQAREVAAAVERTRPGGRLVTWEQAPDLLARDGRTGWCWCIRVRCPARPGRTGTCCPLWRARPSGRPAFRGPR
ncbi:hypothetical protein ACFWR9_35870 [Streptomyces sp. NPDC058534]|uniref:hypothetical protein n=1 Tax=Streptomyces sp. NPDC058534 TaxID=3346541 RepID=UPI00365369AC